MSAQKGKYLLIAGGAVALVVIAAIAALLSFDINRFRSNIEAVAFEASSLDVRIRGEMALSFFPFGVAVKDIQIASKGSEIVTIENLKMGAELLPLLRKQLKVTSCELVKPAITVVKGVDGKYNFESPEKESIKGQPEASFNVNDLKISKGTVVFLDKMTGKKTAIKDFDLALNDLSMAGNFIKSASFTGSFNCKEVLQESLRIDNLRATVKGVKGSFNFEPLTIGALVYFNRKFGTKTELKELNLAISNLTVVDSTRDIIKNLSFTGNLDCKEARIKNIKCSNLKTIIQAEKGIFQLKPFTLDIFGSKGEGDASLDMSEVDALYKINLKASNLDFEKFEQAYGLKKVIGGKGDFAAALTIKAKGNRNLPGSTSGTFSLRGENLVVNTMDIDKILSSYESSQEFNLVDLGAFFIAGPLGNVALKGYHYGDFYNQSRGGKGSITQFISHWEMQDGVAEATDCAFATLHNRVAFKGRLDFVRERYDNVIVALLDDRGCAKFKQSIIGPFRKPQISALSAFKSLADPFSDLYRKAKRFVQAGKCDVIYNGSVKQPAK